MEIKKTLASVKNYEKSKAFRLQVMEGDTETMTNIQNVICEIIKDPAVENITKFLALKLAKDTIEVFNDQFISELQLSILPLLERIALFKAGNNDPDRGSTIFNLINPSKDDLLIGNSFFRLVLECIFVWSRWFPIDPETQKLSHYKICYEKLIRQKVFFPKVQCYFDFKLIRKHMPDQTVPIEMIKECKNVILSDLQRTNNQGSSIALIGVQLTKSLKQCLQLHFSTRDIFYTDILIRCKNKVKRQLEHKKQINPMVSASPRAANVNPYQSLKITSSQAQQMYHMDVMRNPNFSINPNLRQSRQLSQIVKKIQNRSPSSNRYMQIAPPGLLQSMSPRMQVPSPAATISSARARSPQFFSAQPQYQSPRNLTSGLYRKAY